ncbi:RpA-70 [Bugula neritina]|uniref:Replication protein A subunit n=1 Tax=Bugula neritina TaxID=10212 RepID=A0A7J7JQD0_BUGNE|nr:RpA-70 [Bugula neritina]
MDIFLCLSNSTSDTTNTLKDKTTGFYNKASTVSSVQTASKKGGDSISGGTPGRIYPIASLTPYQNRWTIKGRVTQKSGVRTYNNSRGEGKFFNCIFSDESGEIKATAWKSECDVFFEMIELNKVYFVSKAQLKIANRQFSNTNNDYEMNLSAETKIVACDESESSSVPTIQFKFVSVADLASKPVGGIVDVCAIVHSVGEISSIIAKATQKELIKRDVEIVDDSEMLVRLTVWGDEAKTFSEEVGRVLAIKGCKVGDWNGRSLGCVSSSQIVCDPDCADAHRLRGWYDTHGQNTQFKSYAGDGGSGGISSQSRTWRTFDSIRANKVGMGDKPDYYNVKGFAAFIKKENCLYKACSSENCNKKVFENGDGTYRCEKCNKSSPDFKHRLLLQAHLADMTGYHWATAFQDCAEKLLGKTAQEMGDIKDEEDLFDSTVKSALFKPCHIVLRSKMESYNDDNRLKTVMVEAKELDIPSYNKRLLSEVRKMLGK